MATALVGLGTAVAVWLFLQLWQILVVIVVALMLVGVLNALVNLLLLDA